MTLLLMGTQSCRDGFELLQKTPSSSGAGDGDSPGGAGGDGDGDGDGDMNAGGSSAGGASTGGASTGGAASGGSAPGGMGGLPDSGEMVDCPVDALFCSGFEPLLTFQWDDVHRSAGSTLNRVASPTLSGSRALYAAGDDAVDEARVEYLFDTSVNSDWLSIRGFFYVPSGADIQGPLEVLSLQDPEGGVDYKVSLHLDVGDALTMEATTGILPTTMTTTTNVFTRDNWHCAVLRVDVSDPGTVEINLDGATSLSNTGGDTHPGDGFARALVGFYKSGHSDVEIYLDDITISRTLLSCL